MPDVEAFIQRWQNATGSERANHQLFVAELCDLLELPRPDPATEDNAENAYVFERLVNFHNPDGATNRGFIDCYRRGAFILEAKSTGKTLGSGMWDNAMLRAQGQAVAYARALPKEEGRPPFVITLDVGTALELYSEFSQSGGAYVPFPDPRSHRIPLADLYQEGIRERLRKIWLEPLTLDPTRISAKVTRDIAVQLATLAKSLEASLNAAPPSQPPLAGGRSDLPLPSGGCRGEGLEPSQQVATFLMRCIFTMFAEDVGLLEKNSFTELLESLKQDPQAFAPMLQELWKAMNSGGFSAVLRKKLLQFNGGLFRDAQALTLDRDQIELLITAARADWRLVEPTIFGTLLERALDPHERHKLGAHYTPRAYVERLVLPTLINPLREEWENIKTAALLLDQQGKHGKAVEEVKAFHYRLCHLRILDPACGSGNFLYVTLEHLKRLEGEVLNVLDQLGETQGLLELQGVTVDPHQFLGIETNPRAAAIAELVIWIGYLQWHFRTQPDTLPAEPILQDFRNIENRDAVLAWDGIEIVTDEAGQPVTRWDGRTCKPHPVTGEQVPDETARVPVQRYINPRKAEWPEADFVAGNPPFIGTARMRAALGDGYAEALRKTYPRVPESADFVMYWWHHAADLTREGKLRRFGFITTNSLRQTFNRRVIQYHMEQKKPLSLLYAVPDHPWVDSADGAAVRIAMSVGTAGDHPGTLEKIIAERDTGGEGREVESKYKYGKLFSNLTVGADVAGCSPLISNGGLSHEGVKLHGMGFVVTNEEALELGLGKIDGLEQHIRDYYNGRDIAQTRRHVKAIDLFGLEAEEARSRFPAVYQRVVDRVKPERDQNNREVYRKYWWVYGEPRKDMRPALETLSQYFVTVKTAKHRFFQALERRAIPDSKLIVIASGDFFVLGTLSSRIHVVWSFASGALLEDRPTYVKTHCFDAFPFPEASETQKERIRDLAEQIDAHRKRQQQQYPGLTLTGMYNVLEKLRKIDPTPNPLPQGEGAGSSPHRGEAGRGVSGTSAIADRLGSQSEDPPPGPLPRGGGAGSSHLVDVQGKEPRQKSPLPPALKAFARELRGNLTDAEQALWYFLRKKQIAGKKFRRQHAIDPYVLDFYCHELKLAIELDGGQHNEDGALARDRRRSDYLEAQGIRVIRFWNQEVFQETEAVLEAIYGEVLALSGDQVSNEDPPCASCRQGGGEGSSPHRGEVGRGVSGTSAIADRLGSQIEDPPPGPLPRGGGVGPSPHRGEAGRGVSGASAIADQLGSQSENPPPGPLPRGGGAGSTPKKWGHEKEHDSAMVTQSLTSKEKLIHEQGLLSILRQLHDELDAAVFDAYGWSDLAPRLVGRPGATTPWPDKPDEQMEAEEELLQRLVDLNTQRAAEEQRGIIRWLRPEYQNPEGQTAAQEEAALETPAAAVAEKGKPAWPKALPEQVQALRAALDQQPEPATAQQLAKTFKRAQAKRVAEILETLAAMGQAREDGGGRYSSA